ncbi:hypothetical protein [Bdellovibrio sp. HCB337]|uniref:hypothetical protein n=1 Tax=Bdellovibrio sp. HCB337 TaxID=3394358 RepID=UPI0039A6EE12
MRVFAALLVLSLSSLSFADDEITNNSISMQPFGTLPKNSKLILEPADSTKTFIVPEYVPAGSNFYTMKSSNLYNVKSVQTTGLDDNDAADFSSLATQGKLMVQKSALTSSGANCQAVGGSTNCTLGNDVPVYKSGFFDFIGRFFSMLNPFNWFKSSTPDKPTDKDVVGKMNDLIGKGNKLASANGKLSPDCDPNVSLPTDKKFQCGVEQALDAYRKHNDKIKKDVIIFNDFADGQATGKMWFLNADGTPAKVLSKNPIPVSRGEGGFGAGKETSRTPNGAILTKRYDPPRPGKPKIPDGIELVGLEPGNKDIHGRGILLHGWDPYDYTAGCLGVAGEVVLRKYGNKPITMGPQPPYLDELKEGLLKDGGVLIYNFTPAKNALCN